MLFNWKFILNANCLAVRFLSGFDCLWNIGADPQSPITTWRLKFLTWWLIFGFKVDAEFFDEFIYGIFIYYFYFNLFILWRFYYTLWQVLLFYCNNLMKIAFLWRESYVFFVILWWKSRVFSQNCAFPAIIRRKLLF